MDLYDFCMKYNISCVHDGMLHIEMKTYSSPYTVEIPRPLLVVYGIYIGDVLYADCCSLWQTF
jgi:hypothetical protein